MVNQALRIKIAYRSEEKKEEEEKIPGIGRYPISQKTKYFMPAGHISLAF